MNLGGLLLAPIRIYKKRVQKLIERCVAVVNENI